jgi:hypothetical protein
MEGKLTDMVPRMHPRFIVLTWSYGMCEWMRVSLAGIMQLSKHFEVFTFNQSMNPAMLTSNTFNNVIDLL